MKPRISYGCWFDIHIRVPLKLSTVSLAFLCTFQLVIIFSFAIYLFMSSWGKKKILKKCYMLMISFLTAILSAPFCTYVIMKQFAWNLHLFKFRKLPCWERTPALLNTTLINHSYRVDITFLLNSQWAGKLALPAITILISLGNVFIYKVLLPYLEPFIHTLLTKERAFLCALVINHICGMMWPHWQAPASDWSSSFTVNIHWYLLSCAVPELPLCISNIMRWFPSLHTYRMVIGKTETLKLSGRYKDEENRVFCWFISM